jgi:predicted Zn-dependent protease
LVTVVKSAGRRHRPFGQLPDGLPFERLVPRMNVLHEASAETLGVRGPTRAVTRLAAGCWTAGWLAVAGSLGSQANRYGWRVTTIVFITIWMLVGVTALIAIAWAAAGLPERITVTGQELRVRRGVGPFGRTLCFDGAEVRALRVLAAASPLAATYRAILSFWDRGAGRLGLDVGGRTYAFAPCIDDATAMSVLARIAAHLPGALVQPSDIEPETPYSRRRQPGWVTHVTAWVLIAPILIPLRTAITDLPICTSGAFGGPYYPIDVSRLDRTGRIVLAPFGDFPPSVARNLAAHFANRYGLDVVVASPLALPHDAWDANRGQVDSEVLLGTLASAYPVTSRRTIVIGLTNADMFNSGVGWQYAFSNRREPRFAVVSPVRMDRGCMGFPAAESTVMARLRKMVGKNIGVLFFRLPLSGHPRSMMYRSIGGPQELDTMLEEF